MKNQSKIIIGVALLVAGLASCRKGDDLYTSPNQPITATAASMLSACEVGTFNSQEGGTVRIASILMQNSSGVGGQMTQPEQYSLLESDMDNYWNTLYPTMLNCKLLIDTYGGDLNPNYRGIAKVLMAMNLGMTTDMWGDCPYSEAFQGASGNYTPHFDPQQNVLNSIQTLLDGAIADLANTNNHISPGTDDFVFNGNVAAWTKVAWTLKARYYMRLSKKAGFDANIVLTDLANGIASNDDNCNTIHGAGASEGNQWASFLDNRPGYIVASQSLIDSMGNMTDPRTPYYFDTTGVGSATGNVIGNSDGAVSGWGPYVGGYDDQGYTNGNKNLPMVSYAEALFLEAEAKARLGDGTAFTSLNNAIMASVQEVTGNANDGSSIATYTGANTDLHTVILEKWKAMFANPIESYSDYRRTGFPVLMVNPNGLVSFIPKRMPTSLQERSGNPNAPVPAISTPVWYAQ